ncbi:uncharacterized protein LOC111630234 [Centruroides sculpturatus]|uniref:uncharacterized protein LOC111630234 n=1 Tax=Centruroides sculpturatus TaxID=218467 RepID=UPI000C6D3340|nr:uncharacterized protein LOC111630234 [Centruroides sculpturatus]
MAIRWYPYLLVFFLTLIITIIAAPSSDTTKDDNDNSVSESPDQISFLPAESESKETENEQSSKVTPSQNTPETRRYDYLDYVDDNSEQRYSDNEYGIAPNQQNEGQGDVMEPSLYSMQEVGDYPAYDFSNALYRRKRNLRSRALPLRERSFRSSLKDLLSRRKRLSRRALRLKRQTNVDNLLALLGPISEMENGGRFEDLDEVPSGYGILPVDLTEQQNSDYGYNTYAVPETLEDYEPSRLLMKDEELDLPVYRQHDNDQSWMYRRQPVFTVARRSPSYFYPVDYRFLAFPGQKKRSINQGKWGKVVETQSNYNPSDELARLYALANLLAEAEEPEYRYRRSA